MARQPVETNSSMAGSDEKPEVPFDLRFELENKPFEIRVALPAGPACPKDLLPALHTLQDELIGLSIQKMKNEDKKVSCGTGCGACCRQLVPISEAEAHYLAEHVEAMPEKRRKEVERRFRQALEALEKHALLEKLRNVAAIDNQEERQRLGLEYFRNWVACPFLVDESCSIYSDRPLSCREYLVTSPASHCAKPEREKISKVPIPASFSQVLFRFGEAGDPTDHRWLPLVLALEWAKRNPESDRQPARTGHELFKRFLSQAFANDEKNVGT